MGHFLWIMNAMRCKRMINTSSELTMARYFAITLLSSLQINFRATDYMLCIHILSRCNFDAMYRCVRALHQTHPVCDVRLIVMMHFCCMPRNQMQVNVWCTTNESSAQKRFASITVIFLKCCEKGAPKRMDQLFPWSICILLYFGHHWTTLICCQRFFVSENTRFIGAPYAIIV